MRGSSSCDHPSSLAEAADIFEKWQSANASIDGDASGLIKSFYGKADGAVLRIALTAELARWAMAGGNEPQEVSAATLAAAADFMDAYAKPMAERVYGDAALPVAERNAATLARYVVKQELAAFNKRDLKRSPHKTALPALRDAKAMDTAIAVLSDGGWIMHTPTREGDTMGRGSGDYTVNPAVFRRQ